MSLAARRILATGAAGLALIAGTVAARAGAFALHEQGAQPLGMAYAGAAAGAGGLSSMFWNPATITNIPGWQSSFSITGINVNIKQTALPGSTFLPLGGVGQQGRDAIVPSSYYSYQLNDNIWLGLSINAPFGLVTKATDNFAGGIYGRTSKVFSADVAPTLGYKINDWISVGAGLQILYFKTRLTSTSPVSATRLIQLDGDDIGLGYTLGVTLKPFEGTDIGIGYRSRVQENLTGNLVNFPFPLAVPPASVGIKSNLTLPDQISVGVKQRVNDQFSLAAQFEWVHWSLFNTFPVFVTSTPPGYSALSGVQATTLGFRYKNGWFASVGGEYKYNSDLTLRAGLAYERTPISDTVRSVRLSDVDRFWTTIGASYQFSEKLKIDVSYGHIFPKTGRINIASTANPAFNPLVPVAYVGKANADLNLFSVGLAYRWDDPKVAVAAPLVRKF